MKPLPALLCLLLAACATTTVYDRQTGHKLMSTGANADRMAYGADGSLVMDKMNHSTPTLAGGTAVAKNVNALGAAAAGWRWPKVGALGIMK